MAQQEFTSGGRLFLGGLESAEHACAANILGIEVLVDCRDGPSLLWDRRRRPHRLNVPSTIQRLHVPATHLSAWWPAAVIVKAYEPVFRALAAGKQVLVFCINGKHRSAKTCTDVVCSQLQDSDAAMNHVWLRRKIVEFVSLAGPP
jgi:protein-tyrosine phosphatase